MGRSPSDWNQRYASGDTPWDSGRPSQELQRLLAELRVPPSRVLELGCGTGTNAVYLAQQGFDVTAVDVAPLAIEAARGKADQAGLDIRFCVADLLAPPEDLLFYDGRPFPLVVDRGAYHVLREADLDAFLRTLRHVSEPGGHYLLLAGNANEPNQQGGPPRVHAHELTSELAPLFDLVQLREFRFGGVVVDGQELAPLGWSAALRRKG